MGRDHVRGPGRGGTLDARALNDRTIAALRRAFFRLKKRAAPGVDGVTWEDYAADLDRNLTDPHAPVHRGAYRALPSRRRYIPKADGKQRLLGVAAIEDKIVQAAVDGDPQSTRRSSWGSEFRVLTMLSAFALKIVC